MAYKSWEEEKYSWDADPARLTYGQYQSPDSAPAVAAKTGTEATPPSPYIQGAGLGLQALGVGLGAYGAYKQAQQADKEYELQKENFEFEKALGLQDRLISDEERRRRAALEAGGYAGDYLQRAMQNYGGYNRMRG